MRMNLTPWRRRARLGLMRFWLVGALASLSLAACGASTTNSHGSANGASPVSTVSGKATSIRPCLGTFTGGVSPALTLSNTSGARSGAAKTGDTIAIRLDTQHTWRLASIKPSGTLTAQTLNGQFDSGASACVWLFSAEAPGDATVTFSGLPLCDTTRACPQYATAISFTIHVS